MILQLFFSSNLARFSFLVFLDALFFALLVNSGYFFKLGSITIEYEEFLMVCFSITILMSKEVRRVTNNIIIGSVILLICVFMGYFRLIVNNETLYVLPVGGSWNAYYAGQVSLERLVFSVKNIERVFRLLLFIYASMGVNALIRKDNIAVKLIKYIVVLTALQVSFGYLDLLVKLIFNSPIIQTLGVTIFGKGISQYQEIALRANVYLVQGFMREPSHFSYSFIPGLTILAKSRDGRISYALVEYSAVIILFLSTSLTGFAIIFYWMIIKLFTYIKNRKPKYILKVISFLLFLSVSIPLVLLSNNRIPLLDYNITRILGLVGYTPSIGSESIRLLSVQHSLSYLAKSLAFGIGMGSTNVKGFTTSILASIGILGFLVWLFYVRVAFRITKKEIILFGFWLILTTFVGDIGWLFNTTGIAMILVFSHRMDRKNLVTINSDSHVLNIDQNKDETYRLPDIEQ